MMSISQCVISMFMITALVQSLKLPEGTLIKTDKKYWKRVTCRENTECPRAIKRQQKGYQEICLLGNRDWFKLSWMQAKDAKEGEGKLSNSHAARLKLAKTIAFKFVIGTRYYQEVYRLNSEYTLFRKEIQSFLSRVFHVDEEKVLIELFLLKPKLREGRFQVPCNRELFLFLNVDSCKEMKNRFKSIAKVPKCYYVFEEDQPEDEIDELKQKLSLSEENEVLVGLFSKEFNNKMKWFETFNDLCGKDCLY